MLNQKLNRLFHQCSIWWCTIGEAFFRLMLVDAAECVTEDFTERKYPVPKQNSRLLACIEGQQLKTRLEQV